MKRPSSLTCNDLYPHCSPAMQKDVLEENRDKWEGRFGNVDLTALRCLKTGTVSRHGIASIIAMCAKTGAGPRKSSRRARWATTGCSVRKFSCFTGKAPTAIVQVAPTHSARTVTRTISNARTNTRSITPRGTSEMRLSFKCWR